MIRYSFRAVVPVRQNVTDFADWHYGKQVWLEMAEAQHGMTFDEGRLT